MLEFIMLVILAAFFTFLLSAILMWVFKKKLALNDRVERYLDEKAFKNEKKDLDAAGKKTGRFSVLFEEYWIKWTALLSKKVSNSERKKIDNLLRDAGYPIKSAVEFRLLQLILAIGLSIPVMLFILPLSEDKTITLLLALIGALLGYRLPIFYVGKKKKKRIKEINKGMSDFFDTVNILLEAGVGLDSALADVSKKIKGPISEEFKYTLEDMKLGMSRREAFYELRKRVPSDSFQSVITSLIQADQMGIGLVKVLRNISVRIREQRREAAREQAMKAPVKMLFPMVFFILPSLFVVILGPLAIYLITNGLGGK